jgi:hypothetical protein
MITTNPSDVMRRALLKIDDALVFHALDQLNLKSSAKISAVVGVPLRGLQQKRDVTTFATGAPIVAVRAMLELLALDPLEKIIEALGEHAENPTFEQLSEAIDAVQDHGVSTDEVVAVLAFAVGEKFPAANQCRRLLEERTELELPALPEVVAAPTLLAPKKADDELREQRRKRREEEKLKKKAQLASRSLRPSKSTKTQKAPRTTQAASPALEVPEILRRRFIFTPSELETFDPNHPLVGSVVLAEVPFDAVDPLIPEQRSKVRPVVVVAASDGAILALGIYSNQSPSRGLFKAWRRLGLAHVSYVSSERVALVTPTQSLERIGRLSDEEWNSLF